MRRRGFTLIELLVVIAIIGILAAMLFPVFARARESARKTQCLANVKNIATAINMYVADWDKFFPLATDRRAAEWFRANGPRGAAQDPWPNVCNHVRQANPYLREPVILEDYVKNRDVWKCPSARITRGAEGIVPMGRGGYWVNGFEDHPNWYDDWMNPPCIVLYPTGWGGQTTDSFVQGLGADDMGASNGRANTGIFLAGIGINDNMHWETPASVNDSAHYITVGDNGHEPSPWNIHSFAYPDMNLCGAVTPCGPDPGCCQTADPDNCPWSSGCGLTYEQKEQWGRDPMFRKSKTRHLGGVNLGFLDGHAKWYMSETVLTQAPPFPDAIFEGVCSCWYGNGVI